MAHGSTPPLVETIRQIKQNFRGLIPDDIIDRISDDIDNIDDIPNGLGYDEPHDVLYVGVDPFSKSLIAAAPADVTSQALDAAIGAWSKTWGQYRGLNGYFNYFDSTPQYDSFDEYVTAKLGEDPMMSLDEMWAEYEALSYVTERPIMDTDEYSQGDHETWRIDFGAGVPDLRHRLSGALPDDILEEFGTTEGGGGMMDDGPTFSIDAGRRAELIAALEARGYKVIEDQEMISAAQNIVDDPSLIYRKCQREAMVWGFLNAVMDAIFASRRKPEPPDFDEPGGWVHPFGW